MAMIIGPDGKLLVGPGGKLATDLDCCCDDAECPSDCTSCPNVLTATITCPNAAFPGPITFTKQGQPTGCSWNPNFISGYSITSLDCKTDVQTDPCGASPGFFRFAFCISVLPGGSACDSIGSNIDFHKAIASGCPDTGLYVSSKLNWTCTIT